MVRDEILNLPESVKMTRALADEICILDTGSIDGTAQYASFAADKFKRFKWNDDFSSARNASIDLATGSWILILDADEWIEEQYHKAIRALMEEPFPAYMFVIWNFLMDPKWIPDPRIAYGSSIRLFQKDRGFRYHGTVHNVINCSEYKQVGIPICNFNYKERDKIDFKTEQNKRLMDEKIKREGWNYINSVHYADIYRKRWAWLGKIEDLEQAMIYLEKALTFHFDPKINEVLCSYKERFYDFKNKQADPALPSFEQLRVAGRG
jgi:glycosyltransferase involved in cell wall biosynthesis